MQTDSLSMAFADASRLEALSPGDSTVVLVLDGQHGGAPATITIVATPAEILEAITAMAQQARAALLP